MTELKMCTTCIQDGDICTISCKLGLWEVTGSYSLELINEAMRYFQQYKSDGEYFEIIGGKSPVEVLLGKQRSPLQNNSLHKYLAMISEELNNAGLDMKKVLKPEVDIPWSTVSAKEYLWRPIQKVLTGKDSSTKPTTKDYVLIADVLSRHLVEKFGVFVPWPSKDLQHTSGDRNE